jgi:hypothetical protein
MNLVCVVSDEKYDLHASKLVGSILVSNDIDVVHVSLKEGVVHQPSFAIDEDSRLHKIEIPHINGTSEEKRVYSAVCRFAVAKELLEANPAISCLMYIDADSVVRRQLKPLVEMFLKSDASIGLRVRKGSHPYLSGVLILGQASKPFLNAITIALSAADHVWGQDQTELANVISHHPEFKIFVLDPTLVGWELSRTLVVYSAKGIDRRRSPEFMFESWALPLLINFPLLMRRPIRSVIFSISGLLHVLRIRERYFIFKSKIAELKNSIDSSISK